MYLLLWCWFACAVTCCKYANVRPPFALLRFCGFLKRGCSNVVKCATFTTSNVVECLDRMRRVCCITTSNVVECAFYEASFVLHA